MVEISTIKLTDITPADYNPRKISEKEFKKLANSIKEFGIVDPIIINLKNNHIIGGHQRFDVLLDKYMEDNSFFEELNLIKLGDIGWAFPDTDLSVKSEDHEKALNLALNKISGEWDLPKLNIVLEDLELTGFGLDLTGFDEIELEEFDFYGIDEPEPTIEEDDFTPPTEEDEIQTNIKAGDIYQLGDHRLMCGDSTKEEDIKSLLNGEYLHMIFTDPPWNVDYGGASHPSWKQRSILNDSMSTEDFNKFLTSAFKSVKDYLVVGCMVYVVMSAQEWGNIMNVMTDCGYHWSSTIIWAKDSLVLSRKDYHTQYEPIYYGWVEGEARACPLEDRKQSDVWEIPRPKRSDEHPTMKPLELVARAITNSSKHGDNVIDMFGGSGSTLIACEQTGRNCFMMELAPKYCQVIINRWEEFTGKQAKKIN